MKFLKLLLPVCLLFTGCEPQSPPIKGSGKLKTKSTSIANFKSIHLKGDLRLSVDVNNKGPIFNPLEIATDDNVLPYVKAEVSKETLLVELTTDSKIFSEMGVGVSTGASLVESVTLEGLAKAILKGKGDTLKLTAGFKAGFSGADYKVKTAEVDLGPTARATICATEKITGKVQKGATLIVDCGGDYSAVVVEGSGKIREAGKE